MSLRRRAVGRWLPRERFFGGRAWGWAVGDKVFRFFSPSPGSKDSLDVRKALEAWGGSWGPTCGWLPGLVDAV